MLANLSHRSNESEYMDDPSIEEKELKTALSDISRVNRLLGGNNITLNAIDTIITKTSPSHEVIIVDLGCGDGEMLRAIAKKYRTHKKKVQLIGIDLNPKSLQYARQASSSYPEISYLQQNILDIEAAQFSCDLIICTLTLHHLTDTEIQKVMSKCINLASLGVIINDLHRSHLAYYAFKLFSLFFIKGAIAKHDGLVSIKRGFKKQELIAHAHTMGLQRYKIHWKWAFRYCWVIQTQKNKMYK